jgi:dTDP-4-amino-4,6-dideoxygalactose transaminase
MDEKHHKIVPFFKLSFNNQEIEAALRVLQSGYLTQGMEVRRLEEEFKYYVGSRYAIAVDSCTNGLFLSLKYAGVGPGDVVRIPSLTFASVANVILHCGADIEWEDEDYVGFAYRLKTNRPFHIVDAAHQVEWGIYKDFSDSLMSFSFYPTKQISSAEGGMICTNDYYAMEWLEKARWHGRKGGGYKYRIDMPGWKHNMTDLQAVIARIQLRKLDRMNRDRQHIVSYYNRELGEDVKSLHLYTIEVDDRDDFLKFMHDKQIGCSVHFYTPLHLQPAYEDYKKELPKTENKAKRTVSLPLYADMTKEEADIVIKAVHEWRDKEYGPTSKLWDSGHGRSREGAPKSITR